MLGAVAVTDFKPLLAECFSTDDALLNQWHIVAGEGLDACVERTCGDLEDAKVQVYQVTHDETPIGYFGKELCGERSFLTGFFLKPDYRTQAFREEFWKLIVSTFNEEPFFCGLYNKNEPANRFLSSRGALVHQEETISLYKVGA